MKNIPEQDIRLREQAFIEITNFLKKNNIHFFIWGGALLGFRREKNFIKWDWDVEIGFHQEELTNNWSKIISFMMKDKKNNSDKINLVLLKKIGLPIFDKQYSKKNIEFFLKNYLRN